MKKVILLIAMAAVAAFAVSCKKKPQPELQPELKHVDEWNLAAFVDGEKVGCVFNGEECEIWMVDKSDGEKITDKAQLGEDTPTPIWTLASQNYKEDTLEKFETHIKFVCKAGRDILATVKFSEDGSPKLFMLPTSY